MKQYTFTDVTRTASEVLENALMEPVALTKHGKEKLVILPMRQYRQLIGKARVEAYRLGSEPPHVEAEFLAGLDAILAGDDDA